MPPTAPDRRKLPLVQDAYRVFDVRMDVLVTEARRLGHSVPCKLGCDACCYDVTYATEAELLPAVERVRRMSPHRQGKILATIARWESKMRAAGLDPDTAMPPTRKVIETDGANFRQTYYGMHVPCPLLDVERHRCMVYEDRPLCCRAHWLIDESPRTCADVGVHSTTQNIMPLCELVDFERTVYGAAKPSPGLLPRLVQRMLSA